jgi:uncharacterized membrane protein YeaQ/YmgE (transglycosylase-associated protein family)
MDDLAPRINWRALVPGLALGLVLVLLEIFSFALMPLQPETGSLILLRAILIYGPTGALIGWRVMGASPVRRHSKQLPAAIHAMVGALILAPLHAFILLVTNAGLAPGIEWFFVEALSAAMMAGLAGAFAALAHPAP